MYPEIVQSDNEPEFLGEVQRLLKQKHVKVIKNRPYHPQSQGKVERQNRIVRSKIKYETQRHVRNGLNWVQNLKGVASAMFGALS